MQPSKRKLSVRIRSFFNRGGHGSDFNLWGTIVFWGSVFAICWGIYSFLFTNFATSGGRDTADILLTPPSAALIGDSEPAVPTFRPLSGGVYVCIPAAQLTPPIDFPNTKFISAGGLDYACVLDAQT